MTANRWLLWIVAFALAVRLIYLLLAGGLDDILHDSMTDQYLYVDLGRSLVEGRGYSLTFTMWMTDRGEPTSLWRWASVSLAEAWAGCPRPRAALRSVR